MAEHSENLEEVSDNLTNQADRINGLIKEFVELKEAINNYKSSQYYWELHYSTLTTNTWIGQIKYSKLQEKESRLRSSIFESTKLTDIAEQELKNVIAQRAIYFSEQCDDFRAKCTKIAANFLRAQNEYSVENLSEEIKRYSDECEETNNELLLLKNELAKLETECGVNRLRFEENDEILTINSVLIDVRENNNVKLLKIKSAQDMLKGLKNEIKQKKMLTNLFNK